MSETLNNVSTSLVENIKAKAYDLGFCLCGVTNTDELENFSVYEHWLEANHYGSMDYLTTERHRIMRKAPGNLAPWARSILVLARPYGLNRALEDDPIGQIAGYAGEVDYHDAIPQILQSLLDDLPAIFGHPVQSKVFCDSAPVLERELACRAGLGWIGKNSCLINPSFGSAFLLAEIFLDCELPLDMPFHVDRCGNCHRCIDACPTGCILPDRTIDANRCISALTIETKGALTPSLQKMVGNHVFGCDVCQSVCPWNKRSGTADPKNNTLPVEQMTSLLSLREDDFRVRFLNTVFMRRKRSGFLRNLCAVLGNIKSNASIEKLSELLASDPEPAIRVSAATAMISIDPILARQKIKGWLAIEYDPLVKSELEQLFK